MLEHTTGHEIIDGKIHWETIEEAYEKALEIESDQTAVLRNLAGVYFKLGNFSASIPLLRISGTFDAKIGV